MDTNGLKQLLHEYIDSADEQELSALLLHVSHSIYDEEFMNILYKRQEDHRNGISKSLTVEECMNLIKSKHP